MAIRALDINKTRRYVCKDDDPQDPTTFILGTLSARDKGAIQDSMTSFSFTDDDLARAKDLKDGKKPAEGDEGGTVDTTVQKSKMHWEAVRRGLKGWENFLDASGKPIPYKTVIRDVGGGAKKSVVPNDLLDMIPYSVMQELAEQIMDESGSEDDAGNSQGQSSVVSSTQTEPADPA